MLTKGKRALVRYGEPKDFVVYTRAFRRRVNGGILIPEESTVQEYLQKQNPDCLLMFNARWSRRGKDGLYQPEETEPEDVAIPTNTVCLLHGYKPDGVPRGHEHGKQIGKEEYSIWLKVEGIDGKVSGKAILLPEIESDNPVQKLQVISSAVYGNNFFVLGDPENETLLELFQKELHWEGTELKGSMPYCVIINKNHIVGCGDVESDE